MEGSGRALLLACPEEMDQDYERRLLRQINHQNLPAETRLAKVRELHDPFKQQTECLCSVSHEFIMTVQQLLRLFKYCNFKLIEFTFFASFML